MKRGKERSSEQGFTLIELMIAMMVVAVAVLGGMMMVSIGMLRNNSNKIDTGGTNVAQTVLERIASTGPNVNTILKVTDCLQTNPATSTLQINTAPGGPLPQANGDIDFTQAPVAGYQMNYTVCAPNGPQIVYDVRWSISPVYSNPANPVGPAFGKMVTASAQQQAVANGKGVALLRPVTLRTIVGM